MSAWPVVALGAVLKHRKEFVTIDDLTTYKRPRVRLHAQGIVLRDEVPGALIKTKQQQVCRAGDFVVAEIDAKVGGFGIVPESLAGALVSSHYFLFVPDPSCLDVLFLGWFIRTEAFRKQVEAQGSTNYAAIRPQQVLDYSMPLPSLEEQRRIVARIEALAVRAQSANVLRTHADDGIDALMLSTLESWLTDTTARYPKVRSIKTLTLFDRYGPRFHNEPYAEDGTPIIRATDIGSDGRIDFRRMPRLAVPSAQISALAAQKGDLLLVRSGSIGLAAVFPGFNIPCIPAAYLIQLRFSAEADPHFVRYCLQAPSNLRALAGRGTTVQNLNSQKVKALEIPLPPLEEQHRMVASLNTLQAQIEQARVAAAASTGELQALLPSILDRAFKGEL